MKHYLEGMLVALCFIFWLLIIGLTISICVMGLLCIPFNTGMIPILMIMFALNGLFTAGLYNNLTER